MLFVNNYFQGTKAHSVMAKMYVNLVLIQKLTFYKDRVNAMILLAYIV